MSKQMKSARYWRFLGVALLGIASGAFAQGWDDLKVTLGVKGWVNKWETTAVSQDVPFTDPTFGTGTFGAGNNAISSTSGYKVAAVPSLSLRYKDFFGSLGHFANTSYGFPDYRRTLSFPLVINWALPDSITDYRAKRNEYDLNFGYFFHPQFGVSVGYKEVKQHFSFTTSTDLSGPVDFISGFPAGTCVALLGVAGCSLITSNVADIKVTAPTIGLLAFAPLGNGFTLYGNGAYGWAKAKYNGSKGFASVSSANGSYLSAEVGVAHALGNTGATVSVGYKFQSLEMKLLGQKAPDRTEGIIVGVSYTF